MGAANTAAALSTTAAMRTIVRPCEGRAAAAEPSLVIGCANAVCAARGYIAPATASASPPTIPVIRTARESHAYEAAVLIRLLDHIAVTITRAAAVSGAQVLSRCDHRQTIAIAASMAAAGASATV